MFPAVQSIYKAHNMSVRAEYAFNIMKYEHVEKIQETVLHSEFKYNKLYLHQKFWKVFFLNISLNIKEI